MNILVFGASLRKDSFNRKLAFQAGELLKKEKSAQVQFYDFKDFSMPPYDGDLEEASDTLPEGAIKFIQAIEKADALVISAPEYNGGISGVLKNAIDWASRADKNPLKGKRLLLLGASPGALGAVRGLWHTRVPFEALGCHVYPEMFGVPKAHEAFDSENRLKDEKTKNRLETLLKEFLNFGN